MELVGLGKGQGFADKASQALAQSIEPTLDMRRLSARLTDRVMAIQGENGLVSLPKISERMTAGVSQRNTHSWRQLASVRSPMK
jgi:hypothetical protein